MDFDEYEYLEKTVETLEPEKPKEKVDGDEENVISEGGEKRRSSKNKSEKNGSDKSHRSKRVKSGEDKGDRDKARGDRDRERGDRDKERGDRDRERDDRDREKRSSRHRSSSKDVERSERRKKSSHEHKDREKNKEREERNGKDKDRDRDKDRGRERGVDKEEKRLRERDNDEEKDKRSGREPSQRSRIRLEKRKDEPDREKDQDRERSRDREVGEREKEKQVKEPDPEIRRHKEKRAEVVEPEVDPERDQRTVFAYQICLKADERDVYEFFSRAGKVRDVRLIMDRNSRRSKGVGYIEFYDAMSVPMAIALSGQTLLSQPVMVKPSEAEKNLVQSTTSAAGGLGGGIVPYSGGARRLYVGNLHNNIREDQLRQVFESFGSVELVQLPLDQVTGLCKGYGFVQFARIEDARAAESLNGQLEIAGRTIKMSAIYQVRRKFSSETDLVFIKTNAFIRDTVCFVSVSAITDQAGMQDVGANPGDFDDDEGGGLSLNAHSRAILMQKLDRSGTTSSVTSILGNPGVSTLGLSQPETSLLGTVSTVSPLVNPGLSVPTVNVPSFDIVGVPSECLLLKNMFDPNSESEPDFDLDIKEDVQEESSKYGTLKHIYVDKNTAGFVYLRFDNTQAAVSAQRALHGRWFAGKMITATFLLPQNYESRFPDSR